MSNTFELIKVFLKVRLDTRKMKKDKGKTITFGVFILLMGLLFTFISVVYNILFSMMFKEFGLEIIHSTIIMCGLGSLLILTTSIGQVKSIFVGKDYDILASMPLTKRQIITAKLSAFYLSEFLFSAIIMIPNIVINTVLWQDLLFIPVGIIIMLLLPVFPIVVSCIVGTLVSLFAERSKFGNIITTILYVLFFAVVMSMTLLFETNGGTDEAQILGMTTMFKALNPTNYLLELAYTKSFAFYTLYIAINIVLLVAVILFIALSYTKLHDLIEGAKSNVKYERKTLETKGQFKTLAGIEFKRLFSSKMYFMNSSMGAIMIIIMSVIFVVSSKESLEALIDINSFAHFVVIISMLVLGIQTPAACSINIEGKNFWIVKHLPINYKTYSKVKLFVSSVVLGVGALISSLIFIVFLKPSLIQVVAIIIIPLLFVFIASSIGLIINLYFYKLNYQNEVEAVKNSASVFISMLAGFVLAVIFAVALVLLSFINTLMAVCVTIGLMSIVVIVLYLININIIEGRIQAIEQ